ncbi:hypothetical protein EYF80_058041 [Liparis tanakae]|uniref:Uncharacterized protein n=1 Tax=Liparis tanakae TaxID=230148 RepID=A0A4Z2ET40_9TELE|nr:hypothetical protein EYF80_058041 [Liparis tanakae]
MAMITSSSTSVRDRWYLMLLKTNTQRTFHLETDVDKEVETDVDKEVETDVDKEVETDVDKEVDKEVDRAFSLSSLRSFLK